MNVMDLMAKIGLDNSEFDKNLKTSENSFSGFGKAIASGAKTIGKVGVAAFAAVGTAIAGATTALVKNATETAAYADQIDKASQKLGFSAEKYQEWDFIMQHSGSSIDAVKGALIKLEKAAESGGEAFETLGINAEEFAAMGSEQQWETAVTALQGITDETQRAELAQELFGKSYQELMPLLNTTAEETAAMKEQVHDLNGVMSDDAVKAGAAFQDSLTNLKTAFSGMKNNLMGEFLPSLTTAMDGLTALLSGDESGIGKIKEGITNFAQTVNQVLPQAIQTISGVAEALLSALPDLITTVAQELPSLFEKAIPLVINAFVSLADAVVAALPSIMTAIQSNIGVITSGLTKIISALGKIFMTVFPKLLPTLLKIGIQLVQELARGFSENASAVIETIFELINIIVEELTNPETLMALLNCGLAILEAVINGISENLPLLLQAAGTLLGNLLVFLAEAIPTLVVDIGKMGAKVVTDILPQILTAIGTAVASMILKVSDGISDKMVDLKEKASEFFGKIPEALMEGLAYLAVQIGNFASSAIDFFKNGFNKIKEVGTELVQGIWNGINNAKDWVLDKIKGFGTSILDGIKSVFDIASPSKKTAVFGKYLAEGLAVGVEDESPDAFRKIQGALDEGFDGLEMQDLELQASATVGMQARKNRQADAQAQSIRELKQTLSEFIDNWPDTNVNVFIGERQIEEIIISGKNRITTRSGGQVNA